MLIHIQLMSSDRCVTLFHVIGRLHCRHHRQSVRYYRPHPVDTQYDNMLDYVVRYYIDDYNENHRQYLEHLLTTISTTYYRFGRELFNVPVSENLKLRNLPFPQFDIIHLFSFFNATATTYRRAWALVCLLARS